MSQSFADNVKIVGVDVFIVRKELPIIEETLGRLQLKTISNRGTKVWPGPCPAIHLTDVHTCRFRAVDSTKAQLSHAEVSQLLLELDRRGLEWVHVEKLLEIDGQPAFSLAQGE